MSKWRTAQTLLQEKGLAGVARHSGRLVGRWWRQGEPWQMRKSPIARLDGCRFSIEPPVSEDARLLLLDGLYEKPERECIHEFLDPALPVVEFGASLGVVSCITNRLLKNPEKHVVVEANGALLPLIELHREWNRAAFHILHRALAYGGEEVGFHVQDDDPLSSSVAGSGGRVVMVPAIQVRQILDSFRFEEFTLICDIEGMEDDLVSQEAALLEARARLLIIEVHERILGANRTSEMLERLNQAGFRQIHQIWETLVFRRR